MDLLKLWSDRRKPTAEKTVEEARAILEKIVPAEALGYLRDSGFADAPEVLVLARHIVYTSAGISPSLLRQPFPRSDLVSVSRVRLLLWVDPLAQGGDPFKGLQCGSCNRVFCGSCISSLEERLCARAEVPSTRLRTCEAVFERTRIR